MLKTLWAGISALQPAKRTIEKRPHARRFAQANPLRLESLENRNMLAIVVGLSVTNQLVEFDTTSPGTIDDIVAISGLQSGENVMGIDLRPSDGQLYGVTDFGNIYTFNMNTGVATFVSELTNAGNEIELNGTFFGVDFNPVSDLMRLTSDNDNNWRIDVDTGVTTFDTLHQYSVTDVNDGADPGVSAIAYTNSFDGASSTELYGIDSIQDALVLQSPANSGTLFTIGGVGGDILAINGFDIAPVGNQAIAALTVGSLTSLYSIDLDTGFATSLGAIGDGGAQVRGIALLPAESATSGIAYGINENDELLEFNPADPTDILFATPIDGLFGTETIVGVDVRPADGQLYALGSLGTIYVIDPFTAEAFEVSILNDGFDDLALDGTRFGVDFNPAVDRLRITSNTGLNWRVNVDTGLVIEDLPLEYIGNDENAGENPNVTAIAYTDNFLGTSVTELYGIDTDLDVLVFIDPPNNGTLFTVGQLGVDVISVNGFDVRSDDGDALASLTTDNGTFLFRIDLFTGAATALGFVGNGNEDLVGLAFAGDNVVAPGTLQFSSVNYVVTEGNTDAVITVVRTGGADGTVTVDYISSDGSATAGDDYLFVTGTLVFEDGETERTFVVPIVSDAEIEADETVFLDLGNVTGGAALGGINATTLTILDNDDDGGGGGPLPPGSNANFLRNLYADVLGRAPEPSGQGYWLAQLNQGTSRHEVARAFLTGVEYRQLWVNDVYMDFLGRAADSGGLNFWTNNLLNGVSEQSVLVGIVSSAEYFNINGGTDADYVDALYNDLLGGDPSAEERQVALIRLQNGSTTRAGLAFEITNGLEYLGLQVDDSTELTGDLETDGPSQAWYQDYLVRDADEGGRQFFVNSLFRGASRADVQASILASEEYFAKFV